jgi:hypothetical protein
MTTALPQPLTNVQMELLRLYSTGISDEQLLELKEVISRFLFEKAMDLADAEWDKRGYSPATVEGWLANEGE